MFRDRRHAAHLLAEELEAYRDSDAVVMAIPRGGVPIGYHLAGYLHLPLDIVLSKRIKDPTHSYKSIGSVSLDGIDLLENSNAIPQDYICHQANMIKSGLNAQYKLYRGNEEPISLKDKTVLLIDDKLTSESQILACLRTLINRQSKKIIITMPVASFAIIQKLQHNHYETCTLALTSHSQETFYEYLPKVSDEEVEQLVSNHMKTSLLYS